MVGPRRYSMVVEKNVPVSVRDGTVLRADIRRPRASGTFPALLLRTPYGKYRFGGLRGGSASGWERFVAAGYVVAVQDTRGRYESDGQFTLFTTGPTADAEDGYDTVEWLAEQPYCNGRVGALGISYNAWMVWECARLRPPHLTAMCACSIPTESWELDWTGSFRPGRRIRWWLCTIAPDVRRRHGEPGPHTKEEADKIWMRVERAFWLGFLPWMDLPDYLPREIATDIRQWFASPTKPVWKLREAHSEIEIPNLDFTGWYDHCNRTIGHLEGMQTNARTDVARVQTKMVIGPWSHFRLGEPRYGAVDFGPNAAVDIEGTILRWFDHWLKDDANGVESEPALRYYPIGTGAWRTASTWPPKQTQSCVLFLRSRGDAHRSDGHGLLTFERPKASPPDQYSYEPRNPVPTLWTEDMFTIPSDRRILEYRHDILYYRAHPLTEDLEIAGHPRVVLYVSSSACDTDFFARLVDEHPQGQAIEIAYGMARMRHRESFDDEDLIHPNRVYELSIELGPTACCFRAGHRVRLEITSSDFPNHDRNHNTGANDLCDTRLLVAKQRVWHDADCPSQLLLPVVSDSRAGLIQAGDSGLVVASTLEAS